MINLKTERLRFRQLEKSDYKYFASYFSDETTSKYVGGLKTKEEAWRLMATYIGHYHLNGFSYVVIEEKKTQKFVGCVGLWKSEPWPELELGYWILEEMQGKGYASEAAEKIKSYAFEVLKVKTLVSYIDDENLSSKNLAKRIGGVYDRKIELLDFGEHCLYRYMKA